MSFSIRNKRQPFVTGTYNPSASVYGSFSSSVSQDLSSGQILKILYNTIDISASGVYCILPSPQIYVQSTGTYKVLSSLQCDRTTSGNSTINMWISINNNAVPNSATRVVINQASESLMTVEWFINLNVGDFITIDLYSSTSGARALAIPSSGPVPLIPSIITTILKIG